MGAGRRIRSRGGRLISECAFPLDTRASVRRAAGSTTGRHFAFFCVSSTACCLPLVSPRLQMHTGYRKYFNPMPCYIRIYRIQSVFLRASLPLHFLNLCLQERIVSKNFDFLIDKIKIKIRKKKELEKL